MKNFKSSLIVMSVVLAIASVHVSVVGQTTDEESRLAAITASGSLVRWQVAVPHTAVTMTVSAPDGQVFRKEFKAGAAPEFMLFDNEGNKLADGQYNYELRFTPSLDSGVKQRLAASRRVNTEDDASTEREMRKRGTLPAPQVQSGTFTISKGSVIVAGSATEGDGRTGARIEPIRTPVPIAKTGPSRQHHRLLGLNPDQVIPDDLIVQGSLCVGFDCVNNESFGFDTIRLKENNTRIKFEDTSVGTFPTNDWQLTANDSASGGASKFSIEDITGAKVPFTITAGAATNSVFVDSIGRVGMRTSTPVLDLHINTSNTPAIRLEQNNSGGFTAQTWDIAGNEANFFIRDVTGGSRLPFRIRPGAPTSSIDISADGDVGIGTASPDDKLDVEGQARVSGSLGGFLVSSRDGSGSTHIWYNPTGDSSRFFTSTNGDVVTILNNGRVGIGTTAPDQLLSVNGDASKTGGNTWLAFSDERLKTVKGQFNTGLKALMQLQPIRYEYKRNNALGINSEGEHIGFGAQAVQNVIPEAVTKTPSGYLMVNGDPILWTMLNAIKEQQKEIEQLKTEVRRLRTVSRKRR
ncbi:MAG: tail fiber domain-containing protein [Acidobacteriota bacterium]